MERLFQEEAGEAQLRGRKSAGRTRGFRITERDRSIVRWIGRRMVTAAQIAERFGLGRAVSYARLSGLTNLGLLEHQRIFHAKPGLYLATRQGLHAVDLGLPPARVDLRTYRHDVELSSLATELEREFGPERLVTEREIRALAPRTAPGAGLPAPLRRAPGRTRPAPLTPAGHPRLHYPDVAITAGDASAGTLAVELERTVKGRKRLRSILRAYVAARHIAHVRYYAARPETARMLEDEIERLHAASLIELRFSADDGVVDASTPDTAA